MQGKYGISKILSKEVIETYLVGKSYLKMKNQLIISGKEKAWHLEKLSHAILSMIQKPRAETSRTKGASKTGEACFSVPPQPVHLYNFKGTIAENLAVEDTQTAGQNGRKREKLLFPLWKCNSVP